ncbi:MAG: ComEC/Rec2 family competence protein [Chitinophagales bacterium]|nr:ComEC/Rec2 family competence protein [Chitinophagales bacterium]
MYVRLLIAFFIGIALSIFLNLPPLPFLVGTIALFAIAAAFEHFASLRQKNKFELGVSLVLFIALVGAGISITSLHKAIEYQNHFSRKYLEGSQLVVRITEPPSIRPNSVKLIAQVEKLKVAENQYSVSGKLMVYLPIDSKATALKYGDALWLTSMIKETEMPANPHEFNYRQYISFKNIYHQTYAYPQQWKLVDTGEGNPLLQLVFSLRDKCQSVFSYWLNTSSSALVSSLVIGNRDMLNDDMVKAYAATGTIHILSVSGLHVGIVYGIFHWIFGFLGNTVKAKRLRLALILLLLWIYAGLSGLSPSALRATVMFSFVLIGRNLERPVNTFNSLAASAFFLLVIDPYLIMDIGFQLSYLAVAGILLLYPKVEKLLYFEWKPVKWVWQSIVLSITATVATLPLTIYYFHQIPLLSIPANLIVVPASFVLLILGVVLLVFSPIYILSFYVAIMINYLVRAMNWCIAWFSQQPDAVYGGIHYSFGQVLALFAAIAFGVAFLYFWRPKWLLLSLSCACVLLLLLIEADLRQLRQQQLTVYAMEKRTAIDFAIGKTNWLLTDQSIDPNDNEAQRHLMPNIWYMDLEAPYETCRDEKCRYIRKPFFRKNEYLQFGNLRMVVLSEWKKKISPAHPLKVEYLVLTNNVSVKIKDLSRLYDFKMLIIDRSNTKNRADKWEEECKGLKLKCHNNWTAGAFIADLNPSIKLQ